MALADTNAIIRAYLATDAGLAAIVGTRIYCPRLPENATLPAVGFFTRGGLSNPYIPGLPSPSVQFDCWADKPDGARRVYGALYTALQGIQNISVAVPSVVIGTDSNDYACILSHTANNRNRPITGALTATYWVATGGTGVGQPWVSGSVYSLTHTIMSAIEEVQGQDLVDVEIQNYFRVLTYFAIMVMAE